MFSTMPDRLAPLIVLNRVPDLLIVIRNFTGLSRNWYHSTRLELNYNLS
jgi:hypothetical protein